ncbi:MAG: sporulation protein YabP [Clostridia bacterium]|nr:sporulation protein YabP [Clostridia bacterium]
MTNEKNIIQNIILENREKLSVSGVLDILTFDEEEITLETELGQLNIKGENLKVEKLTVDTGEVVARGSFDSIVYSKEIVRKKGSFLKNMFQ